MSGRFIFLSTGVEVSDLSTRDFDMSKDTTREINKMGLSLIPSHARNWQSSWSMIDNQTWSMFAYRYELYSGGVYIFKKYENLIQ